VTFTVFLFKASLGLGESKGRKDFQDWMEQMVYLGKWVLQAYLEQRELLAMYLVLRVEPWESVADLDSQVIKGLQVILDFQDRKVSTDTACIWEYQTVSPSKMFPLSSLFKILC